MSSLILNSQTRLSAHSWQPGNIVHFALLGQNSFGSFLFSVDRQMPIRRGKSVACMLAPTNQKSCPSQGVGFRLESY